MLAAGSSSQVLWQNLRAPQLRALAATDATVIVPVGAMEQHGPHLPVQVDSLLATEVAIGAAEQLVDLMSSPTVVTPTVWLGLSEHHMPLGGTFTLDIATYHALLRGICRSIGRHGFSRIVILNGHGGNVTALSNISQELSDELGLDMLAMTYWTVDSVAADMASQLEKQTGVLHAGEAESSMLMHLRPELVDDEARQSVVCPPDSVGLAPPGVGVAAAAGAAGKRFVRFTPTGVVGVPGAATALKGVKLLEAAQRGVSAWRRLRG
jgi:creatinine amidohydrolase